MIRLNLLIIALLAAGPAPGAAWAQPGLPVADLIHAEPDIESPTLSPSGDKLAYVRNRTGSNGTLGAVIIFDVTGDRPEPIRALPFDREIRWVRWANEGRLLVSMSTPQPIRRGATWLVDMAGRLYYADELNINFIASISETGEDLTVLFAANRRLSVSQTQLDQVVDFLPDDPDHILMAVRGQTSAALDVYRTNVETGRARRVDRGRDDTIAWFTDARGVSVMRFDLIPNSNEVAVLIREEDGQRWTRVARNAISNFSELNDGVSWVARTENSNEALVMTEDEETGRTGLYRFDFYSGAVSERVWSHPVYDVASVFADPMTGRALGLNWADEYTHVEVFDPQLAEHWPGIRDYFGEGVTAWPVQRAGNRVLLRTSAPQEPHSYYVYDLDRGRVDEIGPRLAQLDGAALGQVEVHHFQARDGTELFGYLTVPAYPAAKSPPLVVLPHGGPAARDYYGFDAIAQAIAAEGYMVFQPQFRGSAGFGRAFAESGNGRWGEIIQTDITDGVLSIIETGRIDPGRICVAGWSFGGYSALMQAALEPDLYQCAAAGAPVTDIPSLLEYVEAELDEPWQAARDMLGADDPEAMIRQSPVSVAADISVPVLLLHGRRDRVVPIEQSEAMAEAFEAAGLEYDTYYFDGGHSLDNRRDMQRVIWQISRFLDHHIDPR